MMKQYQPLESLTDGLPAGDALGMRVRVTVDRPMGSRRPRNPETLYPVNCGHVEGIVGGDGAPQNVCILGVKGPVRQFTGRVIAVIHRADGCGEEWVAAPEGMVMFEPEIRAAMHGAEQFFQGSCRCLYEKVCGIVPYIGQGEQRRYQLVWGVSGRIGFPKGHIEADESEIATALRETREEIGLLPRVDDGFRTEYCYLAGTARKLAVFFTGEIAGPAVYQPEEILGGALLPFGEAMEKLNFAPDRDVLQQAEFFLNSTRPQNPALNP